MEDETIGRPLMPISEAVDRYTVFKLRCEHGIPNEKEVEYYKPSADLVSVENGHLVTELYKINAEMWPVHEVLMRSDNETAGMLAKYLLKLNAERCKIRSNIARIYGGYEELKTYA